MGAYLSLLIIPAHVDAEHPIGVTSTRHSHFFILIHDYPSPLLEPGTILPYPNSSMSVEDSQELISAASRGFSELERPTGALHAHNVQVNGGNLTFVNGNVHNYNHINDAPKPEAPKVDLMAALESIDNHRRIQQDT
ncbi:hypothetical protein BKA70DRAFT_1560763, partial [Coprinopsis sp. MPI-PUGE-AT-0042]